MDCVDRISELPEPILHTILSKLPDFEDACRTSVLSKRWRLLWESFPDLNFNEESFAPGMLGCDVLDISDQAKVKKISSKREKFINFVNETVSRRCQNNNMIRIHMFRLEITFPRDMSLVTRMDYWIRRAADANVEVLFLYVQAAAAQNDWWYKLPEVVFASKTITTLYLQFCRFEPNGDIRLPLLQKLSLVNAYIKEQTFQKLLSSCSRIEYLVVDSCEGMDNLVVASSKLNTVKVKLDKSHWLGKVEIKAPNLQAFQFCGEELPCEEINITSCRDLRRVMLSGPGFGVTDCFVSELFSQLPQLESLTLSQCRKVEYVYISSHRLKVLKLYFCPNLIDVKIDAPNLLYFEFGGRSNQTCFLVMNTSNDLQVRLCIRHAESINLRFFESIKVSKNFDRCNVLTLEALFLRMKAFHTEELREELLPLLYNVKHLKLIIGRLTMHGIVSLVDGLLRICPGVEKFSILSGLDYKALEFVYGEQIMGSNEDEGSTYCCRSSHPHRCWRHFLREVTIVNFQNAVFERYLEGFFVQNVKTLKMVRVLD